MISSCRCSLSGHEALVSCAGCLPGSSGLATCRKRCSEVPIVVCTDPTRCLRSLSLALPISIRNRRSTIYLKRIPVKYMIRTKKVECKIGDVRSPRINNHDVEYINSNTSIKSFINNILIKSSNVSDFINRFNK